MFTLLDLCVSSLRRGHANLLCIVPILTDGNPEGNPTLHASQTFVLSRFNTPFRSRTLEFPLIFRRFPVLLRGNPANFACTLLFNPCVHTAAQLRKSCHYIYQSDTLPAAHTLYPYTHQISTFSRHTLSLSAILRRKHRIPSELRS